MEGGAAMLAQNGQLDYEDLIYGNTGLLSETSANISGGDEDTRYYVSGLALNKGGIVKNTGYDKYSAKVNIKQRFTERFRVNVTTSLTNATSDRSITGNENQGSTTLGVAQASTRRSSTSGTPTATASSRPVPRAQTRSRRSLSFRTGRPRTAPSPPASQGSGSSSSG